MTELYFKFVIDKKERKKKYYSFFLLENKSWFQKCLGKIKMIWLNYNSSLKLIKKKERKNIIYSFCLKMKVDISGKIKITPHDLVIIWNIYNNMNINLLTSWWN